MKIIAINSSPRKKVDFISAQVRVVVKDQKIAELEQVEHHNDRSATAEVLPSRIIEQ